MRNPPWVSGPGEILRHGLTLLRDDTDVNRRLAMISIDNSVELMIKTYLGLPRRVTGISISRRRYQEISERFPDLLDALEEFAADKLDGIDLGEIEWYHRVRNELYHQGNGLTVERDKVEVYAELARVLFQNLFGCQLAVEEAVQTDKLGVYMSNWVTIEQLLNRLALLTFKDMPQGSKPNVATIPHFLWRDGTIDKLTAKELEEMRMIRNEVVHGQVDYGTVITEELLQRLENVTQTLRGKISEHEESL
jgi:uncharacterized protein YutE (UPF0331/DUF86 family)